MHQIDCDCHSRKRRIRKHGESKGVPENSNYHRVSPTQCLQAVAEDGHRADFCKLPTAHYRHYPIVRDTDGMLEVPSCPYEITLMHGCIKKRDQKEDQHKAYTHQ